MTAAQQAMPPIRQDPSIIAGLAVKQQFIRDAGRVRSDHEITDLAKARRVVALWNTAIAELSRLYVDLQRRRQLRLEELEAAVPYGPDIPANTSPADRAVLMAAFRSAVDTARAADPNELAQLYRDAEVFGDEIALRAAFTVAHENGVGSIIKAYAQHHPDVVATLDEIDNLRRVVAGGGPDRPWVSQALAFGKGLGLFPEPDEVRALPGLEMLDANRRANI